MQTVFFALLLALLTPQSGHPQLLQSIARYLIETGAHASGEPPDVANLLPEYDFIVVGAGTAGCVVANRLSENPNWKILLIEAGGTEHFIMDVPIIANYLQFTDANWRHQTEPSDKYCLGMSNAQCNWPRGKVMGGSSVLNYMIYTRGNRRDYDNWAAMGNEGWSYDDVLPYFKKVENFKVPEWNDPKYHSNSGYLSVGYAPYRTHLSEAFINAGKEYGLNDVDYNGATQTGVSRLQLSMNNGTRDSSSTAYLHPINKRSNLHVAKNTMVVKLLISPQTKQTYGVQVERGGRMPIIKARKEVIVSAGAINSPQLLMLSGIGPKIHLKNMRIPLIHNLKVGYNLMDHVAVGGITFVTDHADDLSLQTLANVQNINEYFSTHGGPFSLPGGTEALVFADVKNMRNPDGWPDIELLFQAGSIVSDPNLYKNFGISSEMYNSVFQPLETLHTFMVFPMLQRPKSRGKIVLRDNNYRSKPAIFPNYFAYKEDIDTLVNGIKLLLNITEQPSMKKLGTRLHEMKIPACSRFGFRSYGYWECIARHFSFTIYHQSGTCKMGPITDKRAVVDSRLKVHGISGLRVIDASIIPAIPAAHTNAVTYMIAEKGSDMIKQDWIAGKTKSRF